MCSMSPPYNPEQVIQDCEACRPLPATLTLFPSTSASKTLVDMPTLQSPAISVTTEDWCDGAHAFKAVWPSTPVFTPSPPASLPPPKVQYCWKCSRNGHLLAGCPITHIWQRTNVTTHNFLCDYDMHCMTMSHLHIHMEQVAEEYSYHKKAIEQMCDMALWVGYPIRIIPTFDEDHPHEPPPTITS